MRQAEKEIKEFQTRIPLILDPGEQISKKNTKKIQKIIEKLFGIISSQIGDETDREREKRILDLNSAHTRSGGENSEKKQQKNSKIKKQLSGDIFSQNGMTQDEIGRERNKSILDPNSAHTLPGGANLKKKIEKNLKN